MSSRGYNPFYLALAIIGLILSKLFRKRKKMNNRVDGTIAEYPEGYYGRHF